MLAIIQHLHNVSAARTSTCVHNQVNQWWIESWAGNEKASTRNSSKRELLSRLSQWVASVRWGSCSTRSSSFWILLVGYITDHHWTQKKLVHQVIPSTYRRYCCVDKRNRWQSIPWATAKFSSRIHNLYNGFSATTTTRSWCAGQQLNTEKYVGPENFRCCSKSRPRERTANSGVTFGSFANAKLEKLFFSLSHDMRDIT